jgi:hypothetical protein
MSRHLVAPKAVAIFALAILVLSSFSFLSASAMTRGASGSVPVWTRAIRISVLGNHSTWEAQGYTAQQVLGIIGDLKPTLLHRYIGGAQLPTKLVPVCPRCSPMTVAQFLQASETISNASIIARLSLWSYDNRTLFTQAQTILSLPVNPPIRMLSLDDFHGWIKVHTAAQFQAVMTQLWSEGWLYVEAGGCGSHSSIPNGATNFASACYRNPGWSVTSASVTSWTILPSIKFVLGTEDFPKDIPYLLNMTSSQRGNLYHAVAANQSVVGYHMIYFILQGPWDATKVSATYGTYQGTAYGLMKSLMEHFNDLPGNNPSTSSSSSTGLPAPATA